MNILLVLLIGISLSMDTFSLSLCLGSFNIDQKKGLFYSFLVGIFHFIMPLLGNLLGKSINKFIVVDSNKLLFVIFLFITVEMFIQLISKQEKNYDFSIINLFLYAFSVSMDSLTIGIGLKNISSIPLFGCIIFSITAFLFTLLGLFIGKCSYEKLGILAKVLGFSIILSLTIIHFFK